VGGVVKMVAMVWREALLFYERIKYVSAILAQLLPSSA
jgi:hypothetical protein